MKNKIKKITAIIAALIALSGCSDDNTTKRVKPFQASERCFDGLTVALYHTAYSTEAFYKRTTDDKLIPCNED